MSKKIDVEEAIDAIEIAATVIGGPAAPVVKVATKAKVVIGIAKAIGGLFGKKPKRD